jgi:PKD repeat protein
MRTRILVLLLAVFLVSGWEGYRADAATTAPPSSIAVPVTDADGAYPLSWGASATAGSTYVLQEATNPTFTTGLRTINAGTALDWAITGRTAPKTYYYRVKARHSGRTDSTWRVGKNGCAVPGTPAGTPVSITVPVSDVDGAYTMRWGTTGTSGSTYVLQEATNPTFTTGLRTITAGTSLSRLIAGRTSPRTYYYRVRARHAGYTDSAWRVGANGCAVPGRVAAAAPGSITVPASDDDGTFIVQWDASATAGVTYVLEEATESTFTATPVVVYTGPFRSLSLTAKASGTTYYYRVRAVKAGLRDSAWRSGNNGCPVDIPHPPMAAFTVNSDRGAAPLEVTFDASGSSDSSGNIVSYDWDFGDGQSGTGQVVTHRFTDPGVYRVSLAVTDDTALTGAAEGMIVAISPPLLEEDQGFLLGMAALPLWPELLPRVVQAGHVTSVAASIRLPALPEPPITVETVRLDADGNPTGTLCVLKDDGTGDDQAAADGLWTGRFTVRENTPTVISAAVRATYAGMAATRLTFLATVDVIATTPPTGDLAAVDTNRVVFVDPSSGAQTGVVGLRNTEEVLTLPDREVNRSTSEEAVAAAGQTVVGIFSNTVETPWANGEAADTESVNTAALFRLVDGKGERWRVSAPAGRHFNIPQDPEYLSRDGDRVLLQTSNAEDDTEISIVIYGGETGTPLWNCPAGTWALVFDSRLSADGRYALIIGSQGTEGVVQVLEIAGGAHWEQGFDFLDIAPMRVWELPGGGFDVTLGAARITLPPLPGTSGIQFRRPIARHVLPEVGFGPGNRYSTGLLEISSVYGPRDPGKNGGSIFHKGIDYILGSDPGNTQGYLVCPFSTTGYIDTFHYDNDAGWHVHTVDTTVDTVNKGVQFRYLHLFNDKAGTTTYNPENWKNPARAKRILVMCPSRRSAIALFPDTAEREPPFAIFSDKTCEGRTTPLYPNVTITSRFKAGETPPFIPIGITPRFKKEDAHLHVDTGYGSSLSPLMYLEHDDSGGVGLSFHNLSSANPKYPDGLVLGQYPDYLLDLYRFVEDVGTCPLCNEGALQVRVYSNSMPFDGKFDLDGFTISIEGVMVPDSVPGKVVPDGPYYKISYGGNPLQSPSTLHRPYSTIYPGKPDILTNYIGGSEVSIVPREWNGQPMPWMTDLVIPFDINWCMYSPCTVTVTALDLEGANAGKATLSINPLGLVVGDIVGVSGSAHSTEQYNYFCGDTTAHSDYWDFTNWSSLGMLCLRFYGQDCLLSKGPDGTWIPKTYHSYEKCPFLCDCVDPDDCCLDFEFTATVNDGGLFEASYRASNLNSPCGPMADCFFGPYCLYYVSEGTEKVDLNTGHFTSSQTNSYDEYRCWECGSGEALAHAWGSSQAIYTGRADIFMNARTFSCE